MFEAKRFEGMYAEKYAELINRSLKKSTGTQTGYMQRGHTKEEYPWRDPYLKIVLKWGYPMPRHLI